MTATAMEAGLARDVVIGRRRWRRRWWRWRRWSFFHTLATNNGPSRFVGMTTNAMEAGRADFVVLC